MYIALLGRQPALGMAELERVYGTVRWFSHDTALIDTTSFDVQRLGGTVKGGVVIRELGSTDWRKASMQLVKLYTDKWSDLSGKITVGISAHGFTIGARDVQRTAHILKSKLKNQGINMRSVPNEQPALSSASSHHNKLGLSPNKVELLVIRGHNGNVIIAESTGAQNITALARRDQERPARDAFVGMLPPKLAQIMVNLAAPQQRDVIVDTPSPTLLDPFCGTGVLLQEALLLGLHVYGTDLSEKMIRYSRDNINWLQNKNQFQGQWQLETADATDHTWHQPINVIATETYLGQPFGSPPTKEKLAEVRHTCDTIITKFLQNIGRQLTSGTPLCLAVPAWNDGHDNFTHLPLLRKLNQLGYRPVPFSHVTAKDLLYYRPGQVVARELLLLQKQ